MLLGFVVKAVAAVVAAVQRQEVFVMTVQVQMVEVEAEAE